MPVEETVQLSIVLPCYNPTDNICEHVLINYNQISRLFPQVELILVNDGSTRNFDLNQVIGFFAAYPKISIISIPINRGKGFALREGVKMAHGEFIIYTDIDFPYLQSSFQKIADALIQKGCDIAIGVRPDDYYTHLPKTRVRISRFLRWLIRKFLRIPTDDTQCGLKGFNARGKEIFLQTDIDRYLFDLEFIYLAARKNLKIKTVEVELKPDIQLSAMRWTILLQELGNFLKILGKSLI